MLFWFLVFATFLFGATGLMVLIGFPFILGGAGQAGWPKGSKLVALFFGLYAVSAGIASVMPWLDYVERVGWSAAYWLLLPIPAAILLLIGFAILQKQDVQKS